MKRTTIFLIMFMATMLVFGQEEAKISLSSEEIDFGVMQKGSDGERSITVTNLGKNPLVITNCTGSCGCTVPTCPREPIASKRSATISVKYDTDKVGPFTKMITIYSNDPEKETIMIKVYGEVKE